MRERRKAAEPKADAAAQALIRDLKAYVAADGKGVAAGEQFARFAKWYADNKAAGRTVGEIAPVIDDYGDAKSAPARDGGSAGSRPGRATSSRTAVPGLRLDRGTPRKNTAGLLVRRCRRRREVEDRPGAEERVALDPGPAARSALRSPSPVIWGGVASLRRRRVMGSTWRL